MKKNDDPAPKMLLALVVIGVVMLVATGVIDPVKIMIRAKQIFTGSQSLVVPKNFNLGTEE